jgi:PAS domain S-box-containing protein
VANYFEVCETAQGEDRDQALAFAEGIRTVMRGDKEDFLLDYPCHSPNEKRWFTGHATRFIGDGPTRIIVIHENITKRKQAEEELQKSEEKYRNIFNDAILGIYQTTPEGRFLSANPALARMHGYDTPEELINHMADITTQSYVNPEDREIFKRILFREGMVEKFETQLYKEDGTMIWVSINARVVKDSRGNISYYNGTIENITERKRAQEALQESEERYKILTEKTIAGIYLIQDGLFKYVNPTFCGIYGYTRDELVDKLSPLSLVVEEEREFANDRIQQRLSGEKESDQFSMRIRRKDGEIRLLEMFSSYALYAGKPAVLGTCIDMTEARRATEAIKRSQKELRALTAYLQNIREEERTQIAREIHDELGQSLTGIKIDISWLKKKLSNIVEPADPIQAKIDSLLTLTESTIAVTRELSLSLRPGILDDLGLVVAINWQLKRFQEKAGIICMLQTDVAEITIPTDYATALFRISQECLTNISRYANATKVKIALTKEGENLVLEIEDNGKGITTEQIRNPLSLGILGMRERIKNLKGKFHISGAPGKGTKVRVELPIK